MCSLSSSFQDNVILLVRTSYLSECVDMEGAPSLWNSKTMHSRSPHEGPELNDAVRLSVALYHALLLFPANRPQFHLACLELTANIVFPATQAAQLYQNTNLFSQQLSKLSLPMGISAMTREAYVEHVSWFQPTLNSFVLCSCCFNQIQRPS